MNQEFVTHIRQRDDISPTQKNIFCDMLKLSDIGGDPIVEIETDMERFRAQITRVDSSVSRPLDTIANVTITAELQSIDAESQLHEDIHLEARTESQYVRCFMRTKHTEPTHHRFTGGSGAPLFGSEYGDNIEYYGVVQSLSLVNGRF